VVAVSRGEVEEAEEEDDDDDDDLVIQ